MVKVVESRNDLLEKNYNAKFSISSRGKVYNIELNISFGGDSNDYGNGYYMYAELANDPNNYYYIDCRYERGLTSKDGFEKFINGWINSQWSNNNDDIVIRRA